MAPNSITSWEQLEQKFHDHFFSGNYELKLSHLTSVRQMRDESINDYIRRFSDTKNRCFNVNLAEMDLVDLAFNGLCSHIKRETRGQLLFCSESSTSKSFGCRKSKQRVARKS